VYTYNGVSLYIILLLLCIDLIVPFSRPCPAMVFEAMKCVERSWKVGRAFSGKNCFRYVSVAGTSSADDSADERIFSFFFFNYKTVSPAVDLYAHKSRALCRGGPENVEIANNLCRYRAHIHTRAHA